jgi:hypothetical protein
MLLHGEAAEKHAPSPRTVALAQTKSTTFLDVQHARSRQRVAPGANKVAFYYRCLGLRRGRSAQRFARDKQNLHLTIPLDTRHWQNSHFSLWYAWASDSHDLHRGCSGIRISLRVWTSETQDLRRGLLQTSTDWNYTTVSRATSVQNDVLMMDVAGVPQPP